MSDWNGLRPEPPLWTIAAGLHEPHDDEGFLDYCERLGIDAAPLLVELTPRTAEFANRRLAAYLRREMRSAWKAHVEAWLVARIEPERRAWLHRFAESFLPKCR